VGRSVGPNVRFGNEFARWCLGSALENVACWKPVVSARGGLPSTSPRAGKFVDKPAFLIYRDHIMFASRYALGSRLLGLLLPCPSGASGGA
jgi:hypothetical protein